MGHKKTSGSLTRALYFLFFLFFLNAALKFICKNFNKINAIHKCRFALF